jgi:hypothetical protein
MYVDDDDLEVDPDALNQQAKTFSRLGTGLHDTLGRAEVQPLRLGTAPPAAWFATRLAQLADPSALRRWADALADVAENERTTARTFRTTDDGHGTTFRQVGGDLR